MTDKISDIVIPLLRTIEADLAEIKAGVASIGNDLAAVELTLSRIDARAQRFGRYMPEGRPPGCLITKGCFRTDNGE